MILWSSLLIIYLQILITSFSIGNMLLLIFIMEVLSWSFILMLIMKAKDSVFKYVLVQSLVALLFIFGLVAGSNTLFMGGIFMKMGLPPFHGWVINFTKTMHSVLLWFFLSVHKLFPLMVLMATMTLQSKFFMIYLLMSIITLVSTNMMFKILILSSMTHTLWMLLSMAQELYLGLKYWLLYSILLFAMLNQQKTCDYNMSFVLAVCWVIWMGLPPFSIFWLKLMVVLVLMPKWHLMTLLILAGSVLSSWIYFRMCVLTSMSKMSKGNHSHVLMLSMIFILIWLKSV